MSIKFKLRVIAGALVSIIVVMFIATYVNTQRQADDGMLINLAGRQRMLTQKMSKEAHNYLLVLAKTGKSDDVLLQNVRSSMNVFDMTLSALIRSGKAPTSLNLATTEYRFCPAAEGDILTQLKKVQNLWGNYSSIMEKILSNNYTESEYDKFHVDNIKLLKEMNVAVVMMQKKAERAVSQLLTIQMVLVLVGLVFMFFAMMVISTITKRIARMKSFCNEFGDGDLRARSSITGNDELGEMGASLDSMASHLQEIISDIGSDAANLDTTSESLLQISNKVYDECENSSARTNSVAAATEEMSVNLNSVAAAVEETSTNVALMAESVTTMTETIKVITSDTEAAREKTSEAVKQSQSATSRVDELGIAATEISKVTESITEISEQTNLLALNATIEAARAGEAGKGFAVVANEIKDLAKQTAEATLDIRSKIESIQNSTDNTVTEINSIVDIINTVDGLVGGVAEALEEQAETAMGIAENVDQASAGIMEVTENVAQSSAVSQEVSSDLTSVNHDIEGINASSGELSHKAGDLSSLASMLAKRVEKFRT
ncbi:MAG: type IV pili methyl-accepting chemotaxis transducer N-terminal domain-containing protein [Desulfocapsa sp.]|uniref:Type IV pili methyl-accepting chemotaxis transducer N-terminal domain-containing protein n=1 Tax=Desulfotalea psychrophila TaxID=84980 RepID=A0ABS3AU92_9BACT|nr:type IV pili methyl-accepting chemotaxis transducer N-terminal domain-containing protein [Desulfocapsa sp.]MBN4068326.1 type IV pili methyl-accepting chemotaxis transducer N-terminal domain-containing protein [Desulfotalea psychrophila]